MKIFIFEHVCGGGLAHGELPAGMAEQGAAMLWATAADFLAAGVKVCTTLDDRVTAAVDGVEVTAINHESDVQATFEALAMAADVTLVIAPESRGVLMGWLRCLERLKAQSLNSKTQAAATCGDKLTLARALEAAKVPVPATQHLGKQTVLPWPCVVKPRFGAGCENTWICRCPDDLARLPRSGEWIAQPLMEGRHVSCALLVEGGRIRTLPPGEQLIDGEQSLCYHGGRMPLDESLASRASFLAHSAVAAIAGLRGFVGVDMVLGKDAASDVVIEINPRLTLSYVGLRALCEDNLAAALLDHDARLRFKHGIVRFDHAGALTVESGV